MGTEIFLFELKEAEINGFKDGWGQNSMSGPRETFKFGKVTINPIFSQFFCDNYKDLLFIGKLMPRQFQNTPYT